MLWPTPDRGGKMDDRVGARERPPHRVRVAHVARYQVSVWREISRPAAVVAVDLS
jgi:hypothetical protein